ncbi:MAG: hypothetical protein IM598_15900 [Chitinophagaceae bacterium]|nr:hypothetical protein [Chitinophagaceae bacterium]MCA6454389.1 hypothetical protein [Chitinophagaceae bacterium]MCA6459531.1 hypothetical protein [Chitinophagaceae bacterium]MCA6466309.1 hypothetical protein [Chitinophagaceae bacterium]
MQLIDVKLFEDLNQREFGKKYYDFHNDFVCSNISLVDSCFILLMKSISADFIVSIKFLNAEIQKMEFGLNSINNGLTIDSLYRGRIEKNGELLDLSIDGKSLCYLEFYEGQRIEILCTDILVDKEFE